LEIQLYRLKYSMQGRAAWLPHPLCCKQEQKYSRSRLQKHRFTRHLAYTVRYSAVPFNSSLLLTTALYSSVITTLYTQPLLWRFIRVRPI